MLFSTGLWMGGLRGRAREHEGPQETGEAQRTGGREVQAILTKPRSAAAVGVPVRDHETPPPAVRGTNARVRPRVQLRVRARLAQGHPDHALDPDGTERLHHTVDVVDGGPVVVADVDHDNPAERTSAVTHDVERSRRRRALERAAHDDETAAD